MKSINNERSFVEAKTILKTFQDNLNETVKKPEVKAAFTGKNDEDLAELIDKLNLECNKFLTRQFKTYIFRSFLSDKLKDFLNELIKIRNDTKVNDKKRKNIGQGRITIQTFEIETVEFSLYVPVNYVTFYMFPITEKLKPIIIIILKFLNLHNSFG